MAGQPLNTEISIFRRVRAYRDMDRHASVQGMRSFGSLRMSVPGEEIRVMPNSASVATDGYDSGWKSDAWRYGHPVVRYERAPVTPKQFYASAGGTLSIPLRLGDNRRDLFIEKKPEHITDDLHQDLRDV